MVIRGLAGIVYMLLGVMLFWGQFSFAEPADSGVDGITKPFADLELSFVQPGTIVSIFVEEGMEVAVGDPLIKQNDEIELIQKRILKARSENKVPANLAEKELLQKRKDLAKIKEAHAKGAITQWEVDHAALAVDTALLTLKIREFERSQDTLQLDSLVASIKNLTLHSPIAGRIEEVMVAVGETVRALSPVVRIIDVDPLIIDLPTPMDQVRQLAKEQIVRVRFPDGVELDGEVMNISGVADAAATTLDVTIKVNNPLARPAGERVTVILGLQSIQ